jgi:uncharacterized protein (TIGR00251 family)
MTTGNGIRVDPIEALTTGVRLRIQVQPRAARSEVVGLHGGAVKLRIAAPPVDGAANAAVVDLLAERLGIPRSRITIAAGHAGRRKQVVVQGCTPAEIRRRLAIGAK